jgi:5-methylcytosine-specific restriction protein B
LRADFVGGSTTLILCGAATNRQGVGMTISTTDGNELWNKFLLRWPLEKLNQMTIQDYTQAGNPDCFTFGWLEKTTQSLGSIFGGSAFKFGVYSRHEQGNKENSSGRSYSTQYGWYSKYGTTPEDAFKRVRENIVDVANAARAGNLDDIEKADLGSAIKWKIAFLYQDRAAPTILPVYSADHLAAYLHKTSKASFSQLQKETMAKRGGDDVLRFGHNVWAAAEESLSEFSSVRLN